MPTGTQYNLAVPIRAVAGYIALANALPANVVMQRSGVVKITICLSAAAIAYLQMGAVNQAFNQGAALTADCLYEFALNLAAGNTFNIQFSAGCTIRQLTVLGKDE